MRREKRREERREEQRIFKTTIALFLFPFPLSFSSLSLSSLSDDAQCFFSSLRPLKKERRRLPPWRSSSTTTGQLTGSELDGREPLECDVKAGSASSAEWREEWRWKERMRERRERKRSEG